MADPPDPAPPRFRLFEVFGVELEFMIVDAATLDVLPITDRLIAAESGQIASEIALGPISWSNELALHVVELKTTQPASALPPLVQDFEQHVRRINRHLQEFGGCLLPSAMHPWMDPERELRLWPHEFSPVYEAYHRIFDCRGHGWANLQSVHLNLPFAGDEEFGRLHAAIRIVLPLLPGLAAASPAMDSRLTGCLDSRLDVCRNNSARVPQVTGHVIPEPAWTAADYHRLILDPLYQAIRPFDPEGLLQDEFLNARGAIARFARGSIEIRVIDIQECPAADFAVLQLTVALLKALVDEHWSSTAEQQAVAVEPLHALLQAAIRDADRAVVTDPQLLRLLGVSDPPPVSLQQIWQHVAESLDVQLAAPCDDALSVLLSDGPLARRLTGRLQSGPVTRDRLHATWRELADCLRDGRLFRP